MKKKKSDVFTALNDYLELMDSADIEPIGLFKSSEDKEHYETTFMYSFRKYQAAVYHYHNILRLLEKDNTFHQELYAKKKEREKTEALNAVLEVKIHYSADEYVYELAAFLEALKSSIDFLCMAFRFHLKGFEKMDSIRTMIKQVESGKTGPLFDEVKHRLKWLKYLREYRHHVVHRRIITSSTGFTEIVHKGKSTINRHPVIIPESPPTFVPDTRYARMMEESPVGLAEYRYKGEIQHPDGTTNMIEYQKEYKPWTGFVLIEVFMKNNLSIYESFFKDIIACLKKIDFDILK